ncbi:MAG: methionine synthase [Mycobacteriaceae bacterium]
MSTPPSPPSGAATAIGSWPGSDPVEAARVVLGELTALPHLVELPGRGVGADMIGRTAALLVDLAVEVAPTGYRVAAAPGRDHRRAHDLLRHDLDALEQAIEQSGRAPVSVKVQVAGPWTLAASLELHGGHRVLTDVGAVTDFTASLAEGLARHAAEVARRTGAAVVVQLDEPLLPAVLTGSLAGVSRLDTVREVPAPDVEAGLRTVLAAAPGATLVHCCSPAAPMDVLRATGVGGVLLDPSVLTSADLDGIGELLQAGVHLGLGLVPSREKGAPPSLHELAEPALRLVDRLGFARQVLTDQVLVTPACGLAGASPQWARRALTLATELSAAFAEPPVGW